jgi:hypothetical protein
MPTAPQERRVWRESTWPAPTAEDWKKPVLLDFQRTWDDALALAKETGRPILICINMDGEIASEHYAGIRYRDPEIAALYEPYVAVVASVYRHSPRDYDDEGKRILCPRFGHVTCGEHIAMETAIYEKYCDGKRIAPRHICVEPDGTESYDVYYANDTASIFRTIREGIAKRPPLSPRKNRGDRAIVERVASRDAQDREAVETAYRTGDPAQRAALLAAAAKSTQTAPTDLLRLALFGLDSEAAKQALRSLESVDASNAAPLLVEAMRLPLDANERAQVVAALKRLGATSAYAKWMAAVQAGLGAASTTLDGKRWADALSKEAPPPSPLSTLDREALGARLDELVREAKAKPADGATLLDAAETALAFAGASTRERSGWLGRIETKGAYQEAEKQAREAERLGAKGWRVDAVIALACYHTGRRDEAFARAAAAVKDLPPGDASWTSMATLTVFAEGRFREIRKAVREKTDVPPEWIADVNAAYDVLLKHPLGTETQALFHEDLLDWIGASAESMRAIDAALARYPDSAVLHERLRQRVLARKGPAALEAEYARRLAAAGTPSPALLRIAGLGSLAAADSHRRTKAYDESVAAFGRAIALFDRAVAAAREALAKSPPPEGADAAPARLEADVDAALALAGRARVEFQVGKDAEAVTDVVASLERAPAAAGTKDGVGQTPAETAQAVLQHCREAKKDDLVATLSTALSKIDPSLLPDEKDE